MDHATAKTIVDSLELDGARLTPAESLFVRAVCQHETQYGQGWKGAGEASNNWGAVTSPGAGVGVNVDCGPSSFPHKDSRFDDAEKRVVEYVTCFRRYDSPDLGAHDAARLILRSNVRQAVASGDLTGAVRGMRENRYFLGTSPSAEESVRVYRSSLQRALAAIVGATGEPVPFVQAAGSRAAEAPSPGSSSSESAEASLPTLRAGSVGPAVSLWRRMMGQPSGDIFDGNTEVRTRHFQQRTGLVPDGVVGKKTWGRAP